MNSRDWQQYQRLAEYLLNRFAIDFGLSRVEGPQPVSGLRSSTTWSLDAKGVLADGTGFIIVEARHYRTRKLDQEQVASIAYRIIDSGANGAIIVTPLGLQEGAKLVANAGKIVTVLIDADSTPDEFAMRFLDRLYLGMSEKANTTDSCSAAVIQPTGNIESANATDSYSVTIARICCTCGSPFTSKTAVNQCLTCRDTT